MCDNWYSDPQWWAIIVALLVSVMGSLTAIFLDQLKGYFYRPLFEITISTEDPFLVIAYFAKNFEVDRVIHHYLRLKLANSGKDSMLDVAATIMEVQKLKGNRFEKVQAFLPTNIEISGMPGQFYYSRIHPQLYCFFDIGNFQQIYENNKVHTIFSLSLAFKPNIGYHILQAGEYKIIIAFSANNCEVIKKAFLLKFEDNWDDDFLKMKEFISIKEAN